MLEEVADRLRLKFRVTAESNSFELLRALATHTKLISFQIRIGTSNDRSDLVTREIDDRDMPHADIVLGQLRGRNLPVPSAVFAERLAHAMEEQIERPTADEAARASA